MDCSTSRFPVLHYLPEFAQTHVYWVDDAIQSSPHPFLLLPSIFPSIRIFSSESGVLIRWPKDWSFSFSMNIQGWFPLRLTGLISLQSKGLSTVFSNTIKIRVSNLSWKIRGWSTSNLWSSTSTGPLDLRSRCPAGERCSLIFQCLPSTFQYIWQPGSLVSLGGLQIPWPSSHMVPPHRWEGALRLNLGRWEM